MTNLNAPPAKPLTPLPDSLEEAIVQAQAATKAALEAGYTRLSVEVLFPELKVMPIAQQFCENFAEWGDGVKLFFTDAGTAAWAKKNWSNSSFQFRSVDVAGARQTTEANEHITEGDKLYIVIASTAVEVGAVEQLCNQSGDVPVILLFPRLEDVSIVGIGYAGRALRDRFLSTIEPCYHLRPMDDQVALTRFYPTPWQLWLEQEGNWNVIAEELLKPDAERIDNLLAAALGNAQKKRSIFAELQSFIQALGR
jgi:Domain of unknown function (DUF1995)